MLTCFSLIFSSNVQPAGSKEFPELRGLQLTPRTLFHPLRQTRTISHLLWPGGPTPTPSSYTLHGGQRNVSVTSPNQIPIRGVCPLGISNHTQKETPWSGAFRGGAARSSSSQRPGEGNSKRRTSACARAPTRAGWAENNGGKCLSRAGFAKALNSRRSAQFATSPPASTARGPGPARTGQSGRQGWVVVGPRLGPLSHTAPSPPWVSSRRVDAGVASGLPTGVGTRKPQGAPSGLRPGPAPLTHTVSQQHQSRLAWPHSAAVDRHRPSWAGGAGEGARRPLPMEWRMSIEASRSVLSRDWALWNSTTAAAAILPLSHRPRPRPPTPETHARKAHPRGSPHSPHLPRLLHSQSTTGVVVSPRGGEGGM